MQKAQKGFTLIELVVVIVLLGILGVTALAKFQDLSSDAQDAANAGIAAEISSGSSINYGAAKLGVGTAITTSSIACSVMAEDLLAAGIPSGYTVVGTACGADGSSTTCTVNLSSGASPTDGTATILCVD